MAPVTGKRRFATLTKCERGDRLRIKGLHVTALKISDSWLKKQAAPASGATTIWDSGHHRISACAFSPQRDAIRQARDRSLSTTGSAAEKGASRSGHIRTGARGRRARRPRSCGAVSIAAKTLPSIVRSGATRRRSGTSPSGIGPSTSRTKLKVRRSTIGRRSRRHLACNRRSKGRGRPRRRHRALRNAIIPRGAAVRANRVLGGRV